ncbi:hypothetical protein [Streptomyces zingiberis]|uniref:Uncharacterized protein n=1 Tax=Streptomyces zingiberis TaxID=2053010 RepID=A0ABX1BRV1_9ACTN|nr:hypothetical protein [Streptomyces zingiberis]NJQ00421.1 hypothetical protein [Streptomyces zingiberis]
MTAPARRAQEPTRASPAECSAGPGSGALPELEELAAPLLGGPERIAALARTPLGRLPAGDFAVLAWLDDLQACHGLDAETEAGLLAEWATLSLRDVHALLRSAAERKGFS